MQLYAEKTCWICLEPDGELLPGQLCACRGSVSAHLPCLVQIAKHAFAHKGFRAWTHCPTCEQQYVGLARLGLARELMAQVEDIGYSEKEEMRAKGIYAGALFEMGQYGEAAEIYLEMLGYCRERVGMASTTTMCCITNLGACLQENGAYLEAAELHQDAFENCRDLKGEDHNLTLTASNNLASVMYAMGEYSKAAAIHRDILEKRQRTLGSNHRDTLTTLINLATAIHGEGRSDEAERLLLNAHSVCERELGAAHPDTLNLRHNLASIMQIRGRHEEANRLQNETLETRRSVLGWDHPETLASAKNLACIQLSLSDREVDPVASEGGSHVSDKKEREPNRSTYRSLRSLFFFCRCCFSSRAASAH